MTKTALGYAGDGDREHSGGRYSYDRGMIPNNHAAGNESWYDGVGIQKYVKPPAMRRPEGQVSFQFSSTGKGGTPPPMSRTDSFAFQQRLAAVHRTPFSASNGVANQMPSRAYDDPPYRGGRMLGAAMKRPEGRY